jgi:osmoprotectant transport system permease protein
MKRESPTIRIFSNRCLAILTIIALPAGLCAPRSFGDERPLQIGSKSFTESVIIGEMLTLLAEGNGIEAQHRAELGGTQIVFQALEKGDIDAYADYTGTITLEILRNEQIRDEQAMREALERRGVGMSGRLGFNNTYAIGLKREFAGKLNLAKISDLARSEHADLRFGLSEEFVNRADGWPGLKRRYLLPHRPTTVDHNLAYRGLDGGSIDVTDLYSTDAEIQFYDLKLLDDDKGYFPQYYCVVLYRLDLEDRSPQFLEAIQRLEGSINNQEMVALNARAKIDRIAEDAVAAQFLREKFQLKVTTRSRKWYDTLVRTTYQHLALVLTSLLAAVVVALPLGIGASKWPRVGQGILAAVGILQTLPSLAVLVFMVPLLGLGPWPAIVALFFYSLLPIVRNTASGLNGISPSLRESAEVLGLPSWARLWRIELPLASPSILAGIKTAAVINVGTATIGALIGAGGYGAPILTGIRLADTWLILQGAIPAALMALGAQFLFDGAERLIVPRGLRLK